MVTLMNGELPQTVLDNFAAVIKAHESNGTQTSKKFWSYHGSRSHTSSLDTH